MAAAAFSRSRGVASIWTFKDLFFIVTLLGLFCLTSSLKDKDQLVNKKTVQQLHIKSHTVVYSAEVIVLFSHANGLTLQKKIKDDLWEAEREVKRLSFPKSAIPVALDLLDEQMANFNLVILSMETALYDFPQSQDLMHVRKSTMEILNNYVKKKRELLMQK